MQHHCASTGCVPALLQGGEGQDCKCLSAGLAVDCRMAEGPEAWLHEHQIMKMMHTAQIAISQVDALLWNHAHGGGVW